MKIAKKLKFKITYCWEDNQLIYICDSFKVKVIVSIKENETSPQCVVVCCYDLVNCFDMACKQKIVVMAITLITSKHHKRNKATNTILIINTTIKRSLESTCFIYNLV